MSTEEHAGDAQPDAVSTGAANPLAAPEASDPPVAEERPLPAPDTDKESLPRLYRDGAYWGAAGTQFLGAFNDNLFKQLMLMLAIPVGIEAAAGEALMRDAQGQAMAIFSLPFILFSGFAGWLSDRYPKRGIIVLCKLGEIAVMLLGMIGFLLFGTFGYTGLLIVLFLMGTQSAFFGPGKYGILPEMLRSRDLPRANGIFLMTTFLAIILGTAVGGALDDVAKTLSETASGRGRWLALGSLGCVAVGVIGTLTSLLIRRVPAAKPKLPFAFDALFIPRETRRMLRAEPTLIHALLASCMFWLVAGLSQQSINSLGREQLGLSSTLTSVLAAIIALGIAGGAVVAGRLSRGRFNGRIIQVGAWGIVGFELLLSLPGPFEGHLLGFWGSLPVLILLGVATAMFAIPLQVFLQARPPAGMKGRMIALMNFANFVAIFISGLLYMGFEILLRSLDWQRSTLFALTALVMLPVAILYRPKSSDL